MVIIHFALAIPLISPNMKMKMGMVEDKEKLVCVNVIN